MKNITENTQSIDMELQTATPIMALRNIVLFPNGKVSFVAIREKSIKAVNEAMKRDKTIFLLTQREIETEDPSLLDLYKIGTFAKITQTVRMPKGELRVTAEGISRGRIVELLSEENYLFGIVSEIEEKKVDDPVLDDGFVKALDCIFDEYFSLIKKIPPHEFLRTPDDLRAGELADAIAQNTSLDYKKKQEILEIIDPMERGERLMNILVHEINVLRISDEIQKKVKDRIDENQREYFLREELKVIEDELGEKEGIKGEAEAYRQKLRELKLSEDIEEKLYKDISRFEKMQSSSPDSAVIRNYLDLVLSLPWNEETEEHIDIEEARKILDEDHYGLKKVKERILEYIAIRSLTDGKNGSVICLVGPPGTGKTSIAKSIARALNRKYVRISLGGIHDEADIRGHRKTYIGAMPGRIISAVSEAKVKNPLILFDEIDKMGDDYKGDPSAALLEVLDYEQNGTFRDHFAEVPFDLSNVMFITTANTTATIPEPLLDRIEVIEVPGYTSEEKLNIAKKYLLPKEKEKNGLSKYRIAVDDEALYDLINYYTRESGVRHLEREIESLMRKLARRIVEENKKSAKISKKQLVELLGKHRYSFDEANAEDQVGIARGLAWTSVGGDTLQIEVNVMPGSGKIELTGNLGDVMKESAAAAISYIRTKAKELDIYERFYKTCDIHIHVPEGAVPKDGPSAGITMATAIASALTGRAVRRTVAMTGEITLRGNVLPIGGLREKSAAAYRAGMKTIIIPKDNVKDLEEVTDEVKDNIEFISVSGMDEVLAVALNDKKTDYFEIPTEEK